MTKPMEGFAMLFVYSFLFSILTTSSTLDTITPTQLLRDGDTLVSAGGGFELGFFSPGNSNGRYLGIWYKISNRTVVWVANRETPLSNTLGYLNITSQGILVLLNSTEDIVWSSNTTWRTTQDPVAQLLESGNLVVKDRNNNNPVNFLWQSFDYPCDTLLQGMKLGRNSVTGLDRFLSSWKSADDPAQGQVSLRVDPRGFPQLIIRRGPKIQYRVGPWNGVTSSGTPDLPPYYGLEPCENEKYLEYKIANSSIVFLNTLNPLTGILQSFTWSDRTQDWELYFTAALDQCDYYALCGANASCNSSNSVICACLEGFLPKSPIEWNSKNWSNGCVRRTPLGCGDGDGFEKHTWLKLPDTSSSWFDKAMSLMECEGLCLKNCSCTAYANLDIREGGSGCLLWFGELLDIKESTQGGQDLYIRMATSELDHDETKRQSNQKKYQNIIISSVIIAMGIIILGLILFIRKKKLSKQGLIKQGHIKHYNDEHGNEDLPVFAVTTIIDATNNFSSNNKLGEGGFGPVYKGTLVEGKEIAVKRLSKISRQGMNEFKNEVSLIAKLQHRNLVKLLGCCIQEEEKILIYEYMPNGSLDSFIFDQTRSKLLDWRKLMHIIDGIARGLLYLHQDSRLRIIHRDLKASNILLDNDMNPKISDFGIAKTVGGDESEAKTKRVVGTYGYMSPEYAIDGRFSVKSDVFSFGVLVLEIVSGKKNRGFCHSNNHFNLLGHAWSLWSERRPEELIDTGDSFNLSEVLRCIHVALLCVQQRPGDRPSMSNVVLMLGSESSLPQPKQPGFFMERNMPEVDTSSRKQESCLTNEITITLLEAR